MLAYREHANGSKIIPVREAPAQTLHVLATCHSLAQLDDDLVGDPLEKATLNAAEWNLTKGDFVVPKKGRSLGFKIYHRFHFASALKRMSVITGQTPTGSVDTEYLGTVKGAPETIRSMVINSSPICASVSLLFLAACGGSGVL